MKLVNLTPHTIVLISSEDEKTELLSEGLARVTSKAGSWLPASAEAPCDLYGAPTWGEVEGLPEPKEGTLYIVSALVAGRVRRMDVFSPGTGPNDGAERNERGQVVAVRRLICSLPWEPRPCQCGSGEPWVNCGEGSPYCG